MKDIIKIELPASEAAQVQAEIREQIAEMQRANERIKKNQEEIERLKAKTRATLRDLADLKVI